MDDETEDERTEETTAARRAYSPPAIKREEVFESVAAGCSKFDPDLCDPGFQFS